MKIDISSMPALMVLTLLVASPAGASGNDAWAKFNRDVARRCAAASGLAGARTSRIVGFDDTLGKVATLVTGKESLQTRRGVTTATAKRLCIYDKRSRKAWVDEAPGWNAPDLR